MSLMAPGALTDIEVADPPGDSISALAFSPAVDYLAAASWNGEVRIYQVGAVSGKPQAQGKAMYAHEAPALSVTWSTDGTKVFSGGADNVARAFDVTTGQSSPVAKHDAAVKAVKFFESPTAGGILVTGSWDSTIRYWDVRTPNPIASVSLAGRCYALDVVFPLMVVGSSERHIQVINLTDPGRVFDHLESPLKWQTRTVKCFPSADGYAVGSIEGRVAIQWVDPKHKANNYSFRCHRKEETKTRMLVYAVNDIQFHPVHGTFATAGSDGSVSIWDKDARARTKNFPSAQGPIPSMAFNRSGSLLAYAVSYDWSKGHVGMQAGHVNKIMLRTVQDDDVRRKR